MHVCLTPYHTFLATLIAWARRHEADSRMVLVEYRFDASILRESLRSWKASPFSDVLSIKTIPWWFNDFLLTILSPGRVEAIRIYARAGRNLKLLARYTEKFAPTRVYVYNDWMDLSQGVMHFAKQIDPAARCVYVEDGIAAYVCSQEHQDADTRKHRLFRKLFIGSPWFEFVSIFGTSRWIDECMMLFPDLRLPELKKHPTAEIPRTALTDSEFLRWNGDLLKRHGADVDSMTDIGCVLAVPATTGHEDIAAWKRIVDLASEAMRRQGLRTAVKYHPREFLKDYLDVASRSGILILPQKVSMENVGLQFLPHLKCMIGDTSSCLLSAKWMSPSSKIIACAGTTNHTFSVKPFAVLAKAGCSIAGDEDELRRTLADDE